MGRNNFIVFMLILHLASSCNPGAKLSRGTEPRGEAYRSDDAQVPWESQNISAVESEVPAQDAGLDSPPAPEAELEDESKDPVAMEPVPIGGAYLTCRYPSGQAAGSETYLMECEALDLNALVATASFFKVDNLGNRTPLGILNQNLLSLRWIVRENASTIAQNRVQLVLNTLGALTLTLNTTIAPLVPAPPVP